MDAQGLHNIFVHEAMLIQMYAQCCDWVCVVSQWFNSITSMAFDLNQTYKEKM